MTWIEDWFNVMGGESQVKRHSSGHLVLREPKYNLNICQLFYHEDMRGME